MKNERIFNAIGKISDELIEDAAIIPKKKTRTVTWVRWAAMAACLCLVVCGLFMLQNRVPKPPVSEDNPPVVDPIFRGPNDETTVSETTTPNNEATSPAKNGEKIGVYKIASLDFDIAEMLQNLESAGWKKTKCTMSGEYSFFLKGTLSKAQSEMTEEACLDLAKAFMVDSGLGEHIKKYGVFDFVYESSVADGLIVAYCYFLCEGERTGAYIRFVFEGDKHIGEVQAHVYASEFIDHLTLLPLDEALETACMVNSEGKLEEINADEFMIQNIKLVYVNGLPYYKFAGFGRNIRLYINGFALAVRLDESVAQAQLLEQHNAFKFE